MRLFATIFDVNESQPAGTVTVERIETKRCLRGQDHGHASRRDCERDCCKKKTGIAYEHALRVLPRSTQYFILTYWAATQECFTDHVKIVPLKRAMC